MNQFDRNAFYILVSPRFSLSKTGHFYWNTLAYRDAFMRLELEHRILVPNFEGSRDFLAQNSTFTMLDISGPNMFGHDTGSVSPLYLAKIIEKFLKEINNEGKIYLISFESSLSFYIALIYLCRRNSQLRISINLLDFGYWEKIFNLQQPLFRSLVKILKLATMHYSNQFHVFANSGKQPKVFSELIETTVYEFPLVSPSINRMAYDKFKYRNLELGFKRLVIFPHTDDLKFIIDLLEYVTKNDKKINWEFDLHFRDKSNYDLINRKFLKIKTKNVYLSYGYLNEKSYAEKLMNSSAVLIPYQDELHKNSGSGKAMDALGYGVPVISLKGTHTCQIACKVGACFSLDQVSIANICKVLNLIDTSEATFDKSKFRARVITKAYSFISAEASLEQIVSTFEKEKSTIDDTKENLSIALFILWVLVLISTKILRFKERFK